jgi:hypothetical protein
VAAATAACLASAPLAAQERGLFVAHAAFGAGGAFDSVGEKEFDHPAWQLGAGMLTDDRTWTSLRYGQLDLEGEELPIGRLESELEYLNVSGEYRFRQPVYEFGIFVGVGAYRLDAELLAGGEEKEEAIGIAAGLTGDFDITARFSFVVEFDAHYVFFRETNTYGTALAGLAVHF